MAKGKANPSLVLWVWHPWISRPEIAALHDTGHRLAAIGSEGGLVDINGAEPNTIAPDLILHPAAHQWNDELWDYLDVALKAARARRQKK